ncbi:MAG: alkaline phosphatase family protein [Dehalococcoidia bacterium]|nr:alkaline phosphatase family protein [Dehalococcoidia bacterium]
MAARLRGLFRRYLEKRYHILARLFRVPLAGQEQAQPGSIFIQVDALGHDNLLTVLKDGYMPHLKALIETGGYTLRRWRCGLPSDTPPVQSGLMYGYNQDPAGFYWMDKSTGRRQNCANPTHVELLEAHISAEGGPGLLTGGSSYCTILSGNALRAVFTVSRLNSYHLQNAYGLVGAILFVVFKPQLFFSTIAHFLWDMVLELSDYVMARITRRMRRHEGLFPITRAIISTIFRDVATAGAIMDMFCGLPVTYVSYLGYDIVGHHNGPLSHNAVRTLRGIDRAIGRLKAASRWSRRKYNIYILSDHGMNPSVPFQKAYGQPLSAYVASIVGNQVPVDEYDADRYLGRDHFSPLNQDVKEVERHLPRGLAGLVRSVRTFIYHGDSYRSPTGEERISVIDCSPIAHIYMHSAPSRLQMPEIERLYPGLVQGLVSHPGIGLLMGLEGSSVVLCSKGGRAVLGERMEIVGENPLLRFEEPDLVAQEIRRFALLPRAGDLILFGAFDGDRVVCFQNQLGAHGSSGGDQSYPFFMHPSDVEADLEQVRTAADMYPILRRMTGSSPLQSPAREKVVAG